MRCGIFIRIATLPARREFSRLPTPNNTRSTRRAAVPRGEFTLRPRADFSATVRILRREDYSFGGLAALVPTDFAVGWGPMSDSGVLSHIEISQANRFYFWRTDSWPMCRATKSRTHSANWHVIAASEGVRAALGRLRAGSVVELRGQLVDIEGHDGRMCHVARAAGHRGGGVRDTVGYQSVRVVEPRWRCP